VTPTNDRPMQQCPVECLSVSSVSGVLAGATRPGSRRNPPGSEWSAAASPGPREEAAALNCGAAVASTGVTARHSDTRSRPDPATAPSASRSFCCDAARTGYEIPGMVGSRGTARILGMDERIVRQGEGVILGAPNGLRRSVPGGLEAVRRPPRRGT
jgi:hypothetical protein